MGDEARIYVNAEESEEHFEGKVITYLPEDELVDLVNKISFTGFTGRTITDKERFLSELKKVRASGTAYDMGEESGELRCIASPILDSRNYPVAAIWITGPESRLNGNKLKEYAVFVKETAIKIANRIV